MTVNVEVIGGLRDELGAEQDLGELRVRPRTRFICPNGAGDLDRMMRYAGSRLTHVHIADCFNHKANAGNRYIINLTGVDARIHQHNEIGNGDVDWDQFFGTLRDTEFDGIATVCVFGWEETADDIHRRMLNRVRKELGA